MRKLVTLILLAFAATASAQSVRPDFTIDAEALAVEIVERLELQPGEHFIAVAHPGLFDELIQHLRYEVRKAGAIDLGVLDVLDQPVVNDWDADVLDRSDAEAREAFKALLADVDASVMLPGAAPTHPAYAAIQDLLREGKGRTIHFHWMQGGGGVALPGEPLPAPHIMESMYQTAILTTDYADLAARQREFAEAMRQGEVRVTNTAGTDIRFRIGDRPINFQDGNASSARTDEGVILIDREIELPAGVIRVAPIEESVNGTIAFPLSQWANNPVSGLKLTFAEGQVVDVAADFGRDAVLTEMDTAGEAGRAFREFGLGFNELIAVPEDEPWIPYYGYGAGVVRLSLGDNSELGGDVTGGYTRWNFFTDMTVSIDGDVWVQNGKLIR